MRNTNIRSLLRGAALALVAAGSTALVADEGAKFGDQLSEPQPQQKPQQKPQPQPQQKSQPQPQQKSQPQSQQRSQPKPQPKKKPQPKGSQFGGYLSLALPQSNLGNAVGTGFGLGGFWEMPLGNIPNLSGVASAQYLMFGKKTQASFFGAKVESSGSSIGANYDVHYYFADGLPFYGLAGVGFHNCSIKIETSGLGYVLDGSVSESKGKFGFAIGAGYYFTNNLGAEAKYFIGSDDWNYVQASIKYRF